MKPSDLLGVATTGRPDASIRAFSIDRAVWAFGIAIEADLNEAEDRVDKQYRNAKGKGVAEKISSAKSKARQEVLNKYLGIKQGTEQKGRFADPASRVRG